jgi:hypothetical protein
MVEKRMDIDKRKEAELMKRWDLELMKFTIFRVRMPFRTCTSLMVQKGVDKRKEAELMKGRIWKS